MDTLVLFLIVNIASIVESYAGNDYSEEEQDNQYCVCVPFWQCKEDYSGLIEDGIDVIDIRSSDPGRNSSAPCKGFFDVCCRVECGKRANFAPEEGPPSARRYLPRYRHDDFFGFRILGEDNEARFAEFPWMLGVLERETYRCGASLIHPQAAITAAHCMTGRGPFTVRAGEWNWESNSEPLPHQDRKVQKVILHPRYHAASLRNDIAVVLVDSPFVLAEHVGLACLPASPSPEGRRCTASGWGKNSHSRGTYQPTLKRTDLPVVPRRECLASLRAARLGPLFRLHASFMCAGGEPGRDTCRGDGGGPLVCQIEGAPGRYEQVGIVSWGLTCGVADTPGVYVDVAAFVGWVDFVMVQHGFDVTLYKYKL